MIVGIDATRNRSGGAVIHIKGVLGNFDYDKHNIQQVHLWSYPELLAQIPDYHWLTKHTHKMVNKNIAFQILWQKYILPKSLNNESCDILLSTDAGTFCKFDKNVVMSRDMLSYEPGMMARYPFLSFARLRLYLLRFVQNKSLSDSFGAIFLTHYAKNVIGKNIKSMRNVKIIPHGVSTKFNGICIDNSTDLSEKIVITYVSNIAPYKNQLSVLEAILNWQGKPKLKLNLIGGGKGFYYDEVIKYIENNKELKDIVKIFPKLSHTEIITELKLTNVFLFASSCENMPNTLVEGMSTGLPIVCSNKGPMPEVLEKSGIYFDPNRPEEIENSLKMVLRDKDLRAKISIAAKYNASKYSWKRCSNETFSYLEELMKGKNNV
jgi:glycosyltransferase involved in cell wall biosynthesis